MFKSESVGDVDASVLPSLTNPQLAALYRELTGSTLKEFKDKTSAIARVAPALTAQLEKQAAVPVAVVPPARARRKVYDQPAKLETPKPPREGTKLRQMVELLSRPEGATFGELSRTIGWDNKNTSSNLWNVVNHCGYGLSEDESGNIRIRG